MRVLVTGGAGFIGGHLAQALADRGTEVAVLDDLSTGSKRNIPEGATFFEADVRDAEAVMEAFRAFKPSHVSHHAAQASVAISVTRPAYDADTNIRGGINVLEACRDVEVKRLLFASTGGALYGEVPEGKRAAESWPIGPKSPYAVSKASFELYLTAYAQLHGFASTTLRYANVYGPRQDPHGEAGVVAIFSRRLLEGRPLRLFARREAGDPGCVRDYVYVADVVAANLAVLDADVDGTFNVGTGVDHTTQDILDEMAKHAKVSPDVSVDDPRPGDLERSVLDNALLKAQGWEPQVSFEEGLRLTLDWFRERG